MANNIDKVFLAFSERVSYIDSVCEKQPEFKKEAPKIAERLDTTPKRVYDIASKNYYDSFKLTERYIEVFEKLVNVSKNQPKFAEALKLPDPPLSMLKYDKAVKGFCIRHKLPSRKALQIVAVSDALATQALIEAKDKDAFKLLKIHEKNRKFLVEYAKNLRIQLQSIREELIRLKQEYRQIHAELVKKLKNESKIALLNEGILDVLKAPFVKIADFIKKGLLQFLRSVTQLAVRLAILTFRVVSPIVQKLNAIHQKIEAKLSGKIRGIIEKINPEFASLADSFVSSFFGGWIGLTFTATSFAIAGPAAGIVAKLMGSYFHKFTGFLKLFNASSKELKKLQDKLQKGGKVSKELLAMKDIIPKLYLVKKATEVGLTGYKVVGAVQALGDTIFPLVDGALEVVDAFEESLADIEL